MPNNRVIKFRIWDKENKKIRQVNSLHLETDREGEWCVECYGKSYVTNEGDRDAGIDVIRGHNFVLMQFTGLHDKNGVEVWEGDIVGSKEYRFSVYWGEADYKSIKIKTWCAKASDGPLYWLDESILEKCEVLGNLHQHPNLLEKT